MKCPKCKKKEGLHTPDKANRVLHCCQFHCNEEISLGGVLYYRAGYWTCKAIKNDPALEPTQNWIFRLRHSWNCQICGFAWDETEPKHHYVTEESQ